MTDFLLVCFVVLVMTGSLALLGSLVAKGVKQ